MKNAAILKLAFSALSRSYIALALALHSMILALIEVKVEIMVPIKVTKVEIRPEALLETLLIRYGVKLT